MDDESLRLIAQLVRLCALRAPAPLRTAATQGWYRRVGPAESGGAKTMQHRSSQVHWDGAQVARRVREKSNPSALLQHLQHQVLHCSMSSLVDDLCILLINPPSRKCLPTLASTASCPIHLLCTVALIPSLAKCRVCVLQAQAAQSCWLAHAYQARISQALARGASRGCLHRALLRGRGAAHKASTATCCVGQAVGAAIAT